MHVTQVTYVTQVTNVTQVTYVTRATYITRVTRRGVAWRGTWLQGWSVGEGPHVDLAALRLETPHTRPGLELGTKPCKCPRCTVSPTRHLLGCYPGEAKIQVGETAMTHHGDPLAYLGYPHVAPSAPGCLKASVRSCLGSVLGRLSLGGVC